MTKQRDILIWYLFWTEVGTRNFSSSPQSQFRNFNEALLQSQLLREMLLRNRNSAIPQLHFWSPQLQARNLRASLLQFSVYFLPWSSYKLYIFFTTKWFLLLRGFKGTVAQDFWPLKVVYKGMIPRRNLFGGVWYPKFRVWRIDSLKEIWGQKSHATVLFKASFWVHRNRRFWNYFW